MPVCCPVGSSGILIGVATEIPDHSRYLELALRSGDELGVTLQEALKQVFHQDLLSPLRLGTEGEGKHSR